MNQKSNEPNPSQMNTTNSKPPLHGPLHGLRVVDATDMRGAMCARLLGDLGADTFMVGNAEDQKADTSEHRFRNANKRCLGLDIHDPAHREELLEVLARTDVFIENLGPQLQKEYGFFDIAERNPDLVHISLSDFGLDGPRANWHLEPLPAFSASGGHFVSGFPDLPPCWLEGHVAHDCASVFGAVGAVTAIMDRRRTSRGQKVEVSVYEAALSGLNPWSIAIEDYLKVSPHLPAEGKRNADATYWVLKAEDGWVRMVLGSADHWRAFLEVIGNPEALAGPEWEDMGFRYMNIDVAKVISKDLMSDRNREELFKKSREVGTVVGPVHTQQEFIDHPQTQARGFFHRTGWKGMEDAPFAIAPWKLGKTPANLRFRAPLAGQKDSGWLNEEDPNFCPQVGLKIDGFHRSATERTSDESPESTGLILSGIRVVEFGAAAVGPELCWLLSELGADVIKIESEVHPDILRFVGGGTLEQSFAFNTECRGRRSVSINMETEEGRQIAFDLCASADIVVENYRGGVLDGLGLGYDALKATNSQIIYASSQGYGRGGPMGEVPAYGPVNSAFAGIHLLWNHPSEMLEDKYPCATSLNHPDHIVGKLLGLAVLSALDYRARTGEGQHIDMAQTEAGAFLIGEVYLEGGREANGNQSRTIVPHNTYPCQDEDSWISIVAKDDGQFAKLAKVISTSEIPKEWESAEGRLKDRKAVDEWVSAWTKTQNSESATEMLQSAGVSAMFVQGPKSHHVDPHLTERGFIVKLNHPEVGDERHVGNPLRMEKTEIRTAQSAPCMGADTHEVLSEVLGLDHAQIDGYIKDGICK